MLANGMTDQLRGLVINQRESAPRQQNSGSDASDSRQPTASSTGGQQQQHHHHHHSGGAGQRTANGTHQQAGHSGTGQHAAGRTGQQGGAGRGGTGHIKGTAENSGQPHGYSHAAAHHGGTGTVAGSRDVDGRQNGRRWGSQGGSHSRDALSDDGRLEAPDERPLPSGSRGRDSDSAHFGHRLHQQIPEGQVPPAGWGMMPMPHWPMPYHMPYGQVPGMPGMQYMMGPSGGMGNMPMPYPYMPVMPSAPGSVPPGYAFPSPASGMPNGMAPPMPMYMYPPPSPWAGATGGAYAPTPQWPYPLYASDQGLHNRLASSASSPNFAANPPNQKARKPRGSGTTGGASGANLNSSQKTASQAPAAAATSHPDDSEDAAENNDGDGDGTNACITPKIGGGSLKNSSNGVRRDSSETASTSTSGTFGTLPGQHRGCNSVGGSSSVRPASSGGTSGEERMRHLATVYVGNLAPTVEENMLFATFIQFGQVTNAQIIRHPSSGISKGYGFVSFKHPPSATMAVQHMNGVNLMGTFQGRAIKVSRYTKANFKDVNKFAMVWPPHPLHLQTPQILEG